MCRKCHVSEPGDHGRRWNFYGRIVKLTDRFHGLGSPERELLWDQVEGEEILEVGIGPGRSIPYHPDDASVVSLDIAEPMLDLAAERADSLDVDIDLRRADVEDLPFDDDRFDCVVSNSTLCCTQDLEAAVAEVRRVLSPDGSFVMLENVRADNGRVAWLQDKLAPAFRWLHGGYFYRDTPAVLRDHGFTIEREDVRDRFGMKKLLVTSA